MVFITLWKSGACECLLVFGDDSVELRLVHEHSIVRRATTDSSQGAVALSADWRHEWDSAAA